MADEKATFAVEVKDDASGAALSAADALKKMKFSIDDDVKALGNMQRAMKQLQSASSVNVEAFRDLSAKIDAQKNKIATTQAEYLRLGGGFGAARKGARAVGDEVTSLSDRLKKVPGPVGDVTRKMDDLKTSLKGIGKGAIFMGIATIAAVALIGGAIFGIGKLFSAAVTNADALHSHATRAGGPVVSLARQMTAMKRDFGKLFSGLNLGPFLRGFRSLTTMFSQSTASGRALKTLLEVALQPLLDGAGRGAPLLKRFFQGIIIAALHVAIIVLTLRNKFRETFGDVGIFRGLDAGKVALYAGMAAAGLFLLVLAPIAITIGAIALSAYSLYASFNAVANGARRAYGVLKAGGTQLVNDWREIGPQLVNGLVRGISSAASSALDAVKNLGSSLADALKEALDIHSPSRVFARIGLQIPAGVEQGIERGAPSMNRTVAELVAMPSKAQAQPQAAAARSSTSVSVGDVNVYVTGAQATDAESIGRAVRAEFATLLEGAGISLGLGVTS